MLGIIRVLTTDNHEVLQEHGNRMKSIFQVDSLTKCIQDQPHGIYNKETEEIAIPKIVALAKQMAEEDGVDAITISCAADPALEESRVAVSLPVLGAGVCGAHAASMVGQRVGIIGITEEPPIRMKEELSEKFHSFSYSPKIRKTTDLFSTDAKEELLNVVNNVIQSGADVILFACTGFSTIRLKDYLVQHIDVPVIDLVEAQAIAYQLINGEKLG
ncbi:aspartate/glutamate racemase family protein [Sporosarcina pasteurii]|uniref:Glutamate racemase n=1 Tax=Sporosarcina pasteurii TaxID=1474 RepID=A0A380BCU7_SPOPA|nr:AroM family protein [Sporosarcina pasteurii]MDS9472204.1 AroM family protein [Sporosarcina pasteurii]QBQ06191.1 hydantoin racemase [Sporosarcina pasteurii]SUI99203.1 glutamate racemase [Sporosarcina pasteurii]